MDEKNENFIKKYANKIKNNKKLQKILIIFLCIVIILCVLASTFTKENHTTQENSVSSYVYNLENKLTNILSAVKGTGKVKVIITVESGMETVVAMKTTKNETPTGIEIITTPVLVNGKVVVLKEKYPEIQGVLIVCQGGNQIATRNKIEQATMSLLDIDLNKIQILTMK